MSTDVAAALETLYRSDWGRIVATLIRLVGDFDLAEDVAQEAFTVALTHWSTSGIPEFPRGWIVQTARNKAIDRLRRTARFEEPLDPHLVEDGLGPSVQPPGDPEDIADDRLRLIFTCCHPALAFDAQVALTLRTLCGLGTDEIARAFLVPPSTMAQRLVRAKRKIREARIPYVVPGAPDIETRLDAVLTVIYLVFTEGYAPTGGASLVRTDLCAEAIRLARLMRNLMTPRVPSEVLGLLALMLLHDARRGARVDDAGSLVVLEQQDRSRWNREQINEALPLVETALRGGPGSFALQAAIAALHCQAPRAEDTDWRQIVQLYDVLQRLQPSPIIALNRAVAVAIVSGPQAALAMIDELLACGDLDRYHPVHVARADLLERLGRASEAAASYERALALATNDIERRFISGRLREVSRA
jgi:RNA polymerase sigma-70 factor, ECF subfamily